MVSRATQTRISGETQASDVAAEEHEALEEHIETDLPDPENERKFRTPGFSRMRTSWTEDDQIVILAGQQELEKRIMANFADAFEVMHDLYLIVREPVLDEDGEPKMGRDGWPVWKRTPSGAFVEDWTNLTHRKREDLLFQITTRLFSWSQRAAEAWTEAMFAKAIWEERFSIAYQEPMKGTIEDRTSKAKVDAREERYFAVFVSSYSRRADAIVRSMEALSQRLKDVIAAS